MKKKWLIALIAAYIVIRVYIAALSSYGFYHGWNEGYYSLIAKNYFSGSLWEQIAYRGGEPFPSVPPMFSYAVYASFKVFGITDISARLVSILAEVIAILGVYILAKELYNEKIAGISAAIFIFIPWDFLWFGRAQTDPLMTALMILAMALYVRAYRNNKSMLPFGIALGLAVFTKQPALAILPVVLLWSYFQGIKRKQIIHSLIYFIAGMVPLLIWLSYYLIRGDTAFVSHFIYGELANRSEPFSDLVRVTIFTAAGISPLIIAAAAYQIYKERDMKNILIIWLLVYGAFVLVRTPPSHEYYSLPLMAPVAIMAGAGIAGISSRLNKRSAGILFIAAVVSTIPVTYALLSFSGGFGYSTTRDVGVFLKDYMDGNPDKDYLVLVQMKYSPQIAWYSGIGLEGREQLYSTVDDLSLRYVDGIINNYGTKKAVLLVSDMEGDAVQGSYDIIYESGYKSGSMNLSIYNLGKPYGLTVLRVR
ncbi:MAG: glycosyltransferase family 39 protein [Candidatus Methanoperedens sp.]|nr:glycosyltransferase family 39 protein [Candidatus Methanoperedens sp.]